MIQVVDLAIVHRFDFFLMINSVTYLLALPAPLAVPRMVEVEGNKHRKTGYSRLEVGYRNHRWVASKSP